MSAVVYNLSIYPSVKPTGQGFFNPHPPRISFTRTGVGIVPLWVLGVLGATVARLDILETLPT